MHIVGYGACTAFSASVCDFALELSVFLPCTVPLELLLPCLQLLHQWLPQLRQGLMPLLGEAEPLPLQ